MNRNRNRNIGRMALSALVMCSVLFAGCQKDDEKIAEVGTEAIYGDYVGGVSLFSVTPFEEVNDGFNVKMHVDEDKITIKAFPVYDLILSIVNDEAAAKAITDLLGDLKYELGYNAVLNKETGCFDIDLAAEALLIELPLGEAEDAGTLKIKVNIKAGVDGSYSVEDRKLTFSIAAESVLLGDEETVLSTFYTTTFAFDMDKCEAALS